MHDPMTVAFEIRYPWRKYGRRGSTAWERSYRASFITIWHVDPERHTAHGNRSDDSCGWFTPPTTEAERAAIRKLGEGQWRTIFEKQWAVADARDYATICYEPTSYDAIYWAWRAIKRETRKRKPVWQYGNELTRAELAEVYSLESNPVDNLRSSVRRVKDAETCGDFFLLVYRAFLRHHRPRYRHPRWHVWHWRFQVHPLQKLRRWLFDRCAVCGKRFGWNESPISNWGGDRLWHSSCNHETLATPSAPDAATGTFHPVPHDKLHDHHAGSVH